MKNNYFSKKKKLFPELFVSRNVGNSIKWRKTLHPPPHTWDTKSEQGNRGYIGYRFTLSLSTIWRNHLPFNQKKNENNI